MLTDLHIPADQETELMTALTAWWELWTAAGDAYGSERNDLDARAAELFNAQVARGGAYRAAWIDIQDALSTWQELPAPVQEAVRSLPADGISFAARAVLALTGDGQ